MVRDTLLLLLAACSHVRAGTATMSRIPVLLYVDPCQERLHVLPAAEARGCEVVLLHSSAAADAILEEEGAETDASLRERVEGCRSL